MNISQERYGARLKELADSYLNHMLLILRDEDRGSNPRNFLDPWWSFTKGDPYIAGRYPWYSQRTLNNPCACKACNASHRRLRHLDWISEGAHEAMERGSFCKSILKDKREPEDRLIVDHAVPLAIIVNEVFSDREFWTIDTLRDFLLHHYKRGLITRREDRWLDEKRNGWSLTSQMPVGWCRGGDPFARYHDRDIKQTVVGE